MEGNRGGWNLIPSISSNLFPPERGKGGPSCLTAILTFDWDRSIICKKMPEIINIVPYLFNGLWNIVWKIILIWRLIVGTNLVWWWWLRLTGCSYILMFLKENVLFCRSHPFRHKIPHCLLIFLICSTIILMVLDV